MKNCNFFKPFIRTLVLLLSLAILIPESAAGKEMDVDSLELLLEDLTMMQKSVKNDTAIVEVLNLLCWRYRLSEPEKAKEYGKRSLNLAKKIDITSNNSSTKGWAKGIAKCLSNLGIVYEFEGNIKKAIEYYTKSIELCKELDDKIGVGNNLNNLGAVSFYQGNYKQAIEYYYKALNIHEESGNSKGVANCLNNLGLLYRRQGEADKAIELYMRSLKIDKKTGNKEGMGHSLNNLGNVFKAKGELETATLYYKQSLNLKQESGNKSGIASSLNNLGLVYAEQGDYPKALDAYNKSLALENELGNQLGIAISLANIGELYLALGIEQNSKKDIQVAIDNLLQSLSQVDHSGDKYLIHLLYENLSQAFKAKDDYVKAYEYYVLFSQFKDSLFNEEKSKEIGKLEANYEMEQRIEKENREEEEMAKELAGMESRRNNLQHSGILIFLVLLAAIVVMMGKFSIPVRLAEGLIFFTFLLFFEFTLVLLDPYIENYSAGAPAIKLSFNALLAALIFPLHAFFEDKIKMRIISKNKSEF